jgi:hypothetical protein
MGETAFEIRLEFYRAASHVPRPIVVPRVEQKANAAPPGLMGGGEMNGLNKRVKDLADSIGSSEDEVSGDLALNGQFSALQSYGFVDILISNL